MSRPTSFSHLTSTLNLGFLGFAEVVSPLVQSKGKEAEKNKIKQGLNLILFRQILLSSMKW